MKGSEYKRLRLIDMRSRKWRTTGTLRNRYGEIAAGTEVRIVYKRYGLDIESIPCPHCSMKLFVRKVDPSLIEEIYDDAKPHPAKAK